MGRSSASRSSLVAACVGVALLFASAIMAQPAAPAKHTLFRARGTAGATVYLLGSVHLLSEEAGKLPPVVDSAFAHAKTIAFETNLDTVMARAPELLARARVAVGQTLTSSMSPKQIAKLDTILGEYGLQRAQVNGFKPWFVSVLLSQLVMQRMGFQAEYGVDVQLNARAHESNKTVIGLESVERQLGLFDSLSPADQARMLLSAGTPESAAKEMTTLKDAWLVGDVAALDSISRADATSAEFSDLFVTARNRSWLPKIEELLKGKDDALVVVGAAHLVGKQGVVELLRSKGYRIDQM